VTEALRRLLGSPAGFCLAMVVFFAWLLAADRFVGLPGQLALGAVTWVVLIAACRPVAFEQRVLVGLVIVIASSFEVFASLIWGLYHYRLGNIPMFVPPGHGLVYLTGLKVSESALVRRHGRAFVGAVLVAVVAWAAAGLTVLHRLDVVGAIGAVCFVAFLLWGRAPAVYGGVFLAVAALELYGTALGTWTWVGVIPWAHLPAGNPPSGVAGGYVLFDVLAIALAPGARSLVAGLPGLGRRRLAMARR
jgi:hypothetical protein